MANSDKLVQIAEKAKSYVSVYDRIVSPARPRWTDEFLSAIFLGRVARNRRMTRMRKVSGQLAEYRKQAVGTLGELLEVARELKRSSEATNAMSIGQMARLKSDIEVQKVHLDALKQSCSATLRAIEDETGTELPEDSREWLRISIPFDRVASMDDRIRHQRQWTALTETLAKVEALEAALAKAEQSYQRSSLIEQRCSKYLQRLEAENNLVEQRFDDLEAEIRVGELEQILSTLGEGKQGRAPLIELRDFEVMAEESDLQPEIEVEPR